MKRSSSTAPALLVPGLLLLLAISPARGQSAAPSGAASPPPPSTASQSSQPASTPHLSTRPPQPPPAPDLAALRGLLTLMRNQTTTPPQVVEAVRRYSDKYPTSRYRETAYTLGMEFAYHHQDYPDMLSFGNAALQVNPKALVPLLLLGNVIPSRVHPTDINREQQLKLASGYNQRALAIAQDFPTVYNGHQLAPQQVAEIQREIRASAYSSLGVIASKRGEFAAAAKSFQQALAYDNARSKPADYYHLGLAQAGEKQYPAALASLRQAMSLGANNPTLQTLSKAEVGQIQRLRGNAPKPAVTPAKPAAAPGPPHGN